MVFQFSDNFGVRGGVGAAMIGALMGIAVAVPAQSPDHVLSGKEVVRGVVESDPLVLQADRRAQEAAERYALVQLSTLPEVQLDIKPLEYFRRRTFDGAGGGSGDPSSILESYTLGLGASLRQPLPTSGLLSVGITNNFTTTDDGSGVEYEQLPEGTLSFTQPLFAGGTFIGTEVFRAARRDAELALEQATLSITERQNERIQLALGQFIQYASARRGIEVTGRFIEVLDRQIEAAELDRGEGTLSDNAVLTLRISRNEQRQTLLSLQLEAMRLEQDLARVLGLPDLEGWALDDDLSSFDDTLSEVMTEVTEPDADGNLSLQQARIEVERSYAQGVRNDLTDTPRLDVAMSLAPLYPYQRENADDLAASVGDYFSGDGDVQTMVSVTMRIPLLTASERAARERIDRIAREGAVADLEDARVGTTNALRVQQMQRSILQEQIALLDVEVDYQRRQLENEEDLLDAGVTTSLRVEEVALDLTVRENERWQVEAELFLNAVQIAAAVGRDLSVLFLR